MQNSRKISMTGRYLLLQGLQWTKHSFLCHRTWKRAHGQAYDRRMSPGAFLASLCWLTLASAGSGIAQTVTTLAVPVTRIVRAVDDTRLVTLSGNTHPSARADTDRGQVEDSLPMTRMLLVLGRSAEQEAALTQFMAEQQDPKSPNFHKWLSAQEFGTRFGTSDADLATIQHWLTLQGFSIDKVATGRMTIEFSGNAGQVRRAFHTEVHRYLVKGVEHTANSSDPQIPEALAPVVKGVASLNDFAPISQSKPGRHVVRDLKTGRLTPVSTPGAVAPQFTYSNSGAVEEDVTPYDLATIYNVLPLWNSGIKGAGQTIAIAGTSDISLSDVATFQSSFGLPNNPPTIVHNGPDPGTDYYGGAGENTLDVEISGGVAPAARVVLVVSGNTQATAGVLLSEQYIVDNQVASIMSVSYGECELALGAAGNMAHLQVSQQGAAEGISIFIASGDQGSAGCENHNAQGTPATTGLQVSGLASTPYVTAVGGTDFVWQSSPTTYWNSTNAANGSSAKGYVPEVTWNSTCTDPYVIAQAGATSAENSCNALRANYPELITTVGGSGGVSACTSPTGTSPASCAGGYAKPAWQTGSGVPVDGKRDIPDVSLFGSFGIPYLPSSKYLYCFSDGGSYPCTYSAAGTIVYQENGGTSASSPAMAGIMALVLQKTGSAQGLANPVLYQLAASQNTAGCNASTVATGNSCVFYDTTGGNNTTPCTTGTPNCVTTTSGDALGVLSGYAATAGYDLTTGLGSMNVTNLVNAWATLVGTPVITVTVSPASLISGQVGNAYSQQFTASGGTQPYSYAITGGALPPGLTLGTSTGVLSGTPSVANNYSFTLTATDSSTAGPYHGQVTEMLVIHQSGAVPAITWNPARTSAGSGAPLGTAVLDATSSVPGSFTYTIPGGSIPQVVTASTVLPTGVYTITATFTPADTVTYTQASAAITFTVLTVHIWLANSTGSVSGLDSGGNIFSSAVAGGGLTIGIKTSLYGRITSGTLSGTSFSIFDVNGNLLYTRSGSAGGLMTPTAQVVDTSGYNWFTNTNNSVSGFASDGTIILSPASGFTVGGMSNPQGIGVDAKGSLWIANAGNNSVTEIIGVAIPSPPVVQLVVNPIF